VIVYGRGRGRPAGLFLLLIVTGARNEIQRGEELRTEKRFRGATKARSQPFGHVHQLLTTFAHHGLLPEENRP
jgi:hypothetical protein